MLKDIIKHDIDHVFMNGEDFAELHIIDELEIPCVIDDETLKERQGTNELDVTDSTMLLFVPQKYLPKTKVKGEKMNIDGKIYTINTWTNNMGMAEITLQRGVSK